MTLSAVLLCEQKPKLFGALTLVLCFVASLCFAIAGPCQFPTLGFVVDRYLKRERFVSQGFWTIEMEIKHDNGRMQM